MRELVIEANLDVDLDGEPARVSTQDGRVVIDARSIDAAGRMLRAGPGSGSQAERLERLHHWLTQAGQTIELRVQGRPIARLGPGANPGAISRLLRLRQAEIDPSAALRQTVRERTRVLLGLLGAVGLAGGLLALWLRRD